MTSPKDLTQAQLNTFFDCRLRALESVLCEVMHGFDTDMCEKFCDELEASAIAPEIKQKMRDYNMDIRNKFKPRNPS